MPPADKAADYARLQEMERQLLHTLDRAPDAVRVREGGGFEDAAASVAVTFSKFGLLKDTSLNAP